jgi:hypothetical protein
MRYLMLLCLSFCAHVHAESGVLVERVPSEAETSVVMAVAKQALVTRNWTVESTDSNSVTAFLKKEMLFVRIRLYTEGRTLMYEGLGRRKTAGSKNPSQGPGAINSNTRVPHRWVANLRRDISLTLSTIPDTEAKTAAK